MGSVFITKSQATMPSVASTDVKFSLLKDKEKRVGNRKENYCYAYEKYIIK